MNTTCSQSYMQFRKIQFTDLENGIILLETEKMLVKGYTVIELYRYTLQHGNNS